MGVYRGNNHSAAATAHVGRPRLPQGVVWRPRLAEALDTGTRHAVTTICAGPGWGKTACVSAWAGSRSVNGPIAWLALDARHNDPYVFWSDLMLALRAGGAVRPGQVVPDRGAFLGVDGPAFLRRLGNGLGATPGPVVIVLDDLQAITEPRVLSALAGLLRSPPERLRLVLISRTEPELPLHRLRAAGELTELRTADLAFRADEAAELLALLGRTMPPAELAALVRTTEGWGAGVRLALDAPPGVEPDDAAADYLIREVLAVQPGPIRQFLLSTSLPDRISGGLAEALTGRRNGFQLLEQLERANLFLDRAGPGGWFRYHRQFRATLRRQLGQEQTDSPARLHLLAARWHAREGSPLTALEHAASAGDWTLVSRLVADYGIPLFVSSDRVELAELIRRIPLDRLPETAELVLCSAMVTYAMGDVAGVQRQTGRVRRLLQDRDTGSRRSMGIAVQILEATMVARWQGNMPALVGTTTEVLRQLAALRWDQVPAMPQYRAIALANKGIGLLWSGELDHADRYLWAATTGARAAGSPLIEINALGHLALLGVIQGALHEAATNASAALGVARRIDADNRIAVAPAYIAQSVIAREQGHETEAEEAMRRALHACGDNPETALTVLTGALRAGLLVDRGEPHTARAVLAKVVEEAGPGLDAPILRRIVDLAQAEVDLTLDDPWPVLTRYARQDGLYPPEQLRLAQAYQAAGHPGRAEAVLAVLREGPDRNCAVSAWLLTALAADAGGHGGRAAEALGRALAAAEPDRIRRPFRRFDAGRIMALAERQQWLTEPRGTAGDSVLAEITGEIPIGAPPVTGPLSEREIEVLQYLPTVLTAGEIAGTLGISVNTVKAHMRSIYRKFGASRRREAIVIARQLGHL
ncbi:transcriptional regulator [Actinoplanes cyaneus]|uniref:Transcriptional regulator n=1 Tax=Actinoplanes cyaneus TaxID=52696 RepID=A0A919IJQ6_9ACTN|nr:LuxR C-terminal-related transcriptional regulator [Actinoplanes cyaneus]MCW2141251.1 LuxR family transcriptional regulator, maltose regulon positive regulatory protein [Actinoplanes cyaneus]GID67320.1 transcriptional regulator [Actinoplanes cyaneus]